jgi:hypothetical protein
MTRKRRESISSHVRAYVKTRDHECCRYCDRDGEYNIDIDHIDGNPTNNDPGNLVCACEICNTMKRDYNWRAHVIPLPDMKFNRLDTAKQISGLTEQFNERMRRMYGSITVDVPRGK